MKQVAALAVASVIALGSSLAMAGDMQIVGVPSNPPHRGINTYAFHVPGYESLGFDGWFAIAASWTDPATGNVVLAPMAGTQAASIEKSIQDKTSASFVANCEQVVPFNGGSMACRARNVDSVNKR